MKETTLTKEQMGLYGAQIPGDAPNGEIFRLVRNIQNDAKNSHSIIIANAGALYWHLINCRDEAAKIMEK